MFLLVSDPTCRLAESAVHWWIDGLLTRNPCALSSRSISDEEIIIEFSQCTHGQSYYRTSRIVLMRGCPTSHQVWICSEHRNDWNGRICLRYNPLRYSNTNKKIIGFTSLLDVLPYRYTKRRNPLATRVVSMAHCLRHGPNPNPRNNPADQIRT